MRDAGIGNGELTDFIKALDLDVVEVDIASRAIGRVRMLCQETRSWVGALEEGFPFDDRVCAAGRSN